MGIHTEGWSRCRDSSSRTKPQYWQTKSGAGPESGMCAEGFIGQTLSDGVPIIGRSGGWVAMIPAHAHDGISGPSG